MATFRSSKTFRNYPCSHRRWRHGGHCSHIHGYSREFIAWFGCEKRTDNGFVMDFGALKPVKAWLDDHFDHTLLLDDDDPLLSEFKRLEEKGACKLVTFPDVGMEGTAEFVFSWLDAWVRNDTNNRVWLISLEVRENDKNSAIYSA